MPETIFGAARAPAWKRIAGLYVLTPDTDDTQWLIDRVDAALRGGASVVQYRNKNASPALHVEQASRLRELCRGRNRCFIVNDDVGLAAATGADGVHLGRDDVDVAAARAKLGPAALIGVSCYDDIGRAEAAADAGADYIAFGSFFPSTIKPGAVRANTALIGVAKRRWSLPVVAIGGITAANGASLIAAGADALAVITAVFDAPDVEISARKIADLFN